MKTDLDKIKDMAKMFLHQPIKIDKHLSPKLCVYHPFLSSSIVDIKTSGFVDVLENKEALEEYNKFIENRIDISDLCSIYILVRKPYRLTFIKYCEHYLSSKDLSELFADAWISTENPNQDANCSISYLTKLFKKCNKQYLMQEEDYKVYQSLPDNFTIYRGVAVNRNPKGLSWTQDLETAKWFAHRFDNNDKKGYVQSTIAKKENVLAYFNTRGEKEIVYNANKSKIDIINF